MKGFTIVAVVVIVLLCVSPMVRAQEDSARPAGDVIIRQMSTILDANSVLGDPVKYEGGEILPIVAIGFCFGSGSGVHKMQSGSGSGGGGAVFPLGLLKITDGGDVEVLASRKSQIAEVIKGIALAHLEMVRSGTMPSLAEEDKKSE